MVKYHLHLIPGTNVFLAGSRHFDLARPESVAELKQLGITKLFTILSVSPHGVLTLRGMGPDKEAFFEEMHRQGIDVSTLLRDSANMRDYESFHHEASRVRGNLVVECVNGKHSSAAYALYHLAKSTRLGKEELLGRFTAAGLNAHDFAVIQTYLRHAGINIGKIITTRDQHLAKIAKIAERAGTKRQEKLEKFRDFLKSRHGAEGHLKK